MGSAWWIGLATVALGAVSGVVLLFGRHGASPRVSGSGAHGTAIMPGPGRRLTSALYLIVLTVGISGLMAAAIGSIVFLGGLSLAD